MRRRGSGILLHITSLPSEFGVGDLGPWATRFVDFLAQAGQCVWQVLPVGPTSGFIGNSPYSSFSAFAGSPLLISPEAMVEDGLLESADLWSHRQAPEDKADYALAEQVRDILLPKAFERCAKGLEQEPDFIAFKEDNNFWLRDYALFACIKRHFGGAVWTTWPEEFRNRNPKAMGEFADANANEVLYEEFVQYIFFRQWAKLLRYANSRGVSLMGDAPIYVLLDSADVWANTAYFKLNGEKEPTHVAGVPPDYFSETGQLWGNPVYDWEALRRDGFGWWLERVGHNLKLYNQVRIDHFRGFAGYWEVPAGEKTAMNGAWADAPGMELFDALSARFPHLPVVAEDLGVITPDVRELRDTFELPGMRIAQFSFGHGVGTNHNAVHNYVVNSVAYTGTHDNNTTRGWFAEEASPDDRRRLEAYLGFPVDEDAVSQALVRLVMSSVSKLAVFPMQDILDLPSSARMNKPSLADGNWLWRVLPEQLGQSVAEYLRETSELFGRA